MKLNRRTFLEMSARGAGASLIPSITFGNNQGLERNNSFNIKEPSRTVPIIGEYDVIVCGGGPAGIAAAISAARAGAKTCLIELYGCLGGVWTTGLLSNIIDYSNKTGVMREIMKRLSYTDAQFSPGNYDAEAMKLILEQFCMEVGVEIRLYTRVVAAVRDGKRLETVITESNSGREAWKAKCFIDTTGNGDLGALAGCLFDFGSPDNGKTQPMSLMAIVCGVNKEDINGTFIDGLGSSPQNKVNLRKEIEKLGFSPSYGIPTLFAIRPNFMALMANHEYGASALNAQQLSNATLHARAEVNKIIDGLRSLGGVWKNIRLVATGSQIGIREGRRIIGRYYLTKDDIVRGAEFDDGVCKVTYGVDIHSLYHNVQGYTTGGIKVRPYDIPLRSLIAKDVDGLMMAGRCISGDFFAHASYRVTGNAVAMGEAAGTICAIASKNGKMPHQVKWEEASKIIEQNRK